MDITRSADEKHPQCSKLFIWTRMLPILVLPFNKTQLKGVEFSQNMGLSIMTGP